MLTNSRNCRKKYLIILDTIIIIIILLSILLYKALENNKLIIGLEISVFLILVLIYVNILVMNSNTFFTDIRLTFILGYLFYNLYTPTIYCFRQSENLNYGSSDIGWIFSSNDVQKSLFISLLYLFGLLLALTFIKKRKTNTSTIGNKYSIIDKKSKMNFCFWLILFSVSFAWYIYPYTKFGLQVISYDRWYRYTSLFNSLRKELGRINTVLNNLFNNYLMLISLFIMFKNIIDNRNKTQRSIFMGIIIFYSIFILFIDFRRRELLIVILMFISYYFFQIKDKLNDKKIKKRLKKITLTLSMLLIFFMVYQQYRQYFTYGYTRGVTAIKDMKSKESESYKETELYYSEFGMVYITNICTAKYHPELLYGKSYIEGMIKPIPIISKMTYEWLGYNQDIDTIDVWLSTIYIQCFEAGGGLGYSPASEAYINFNYLGCLSIGFIIGLLLNLLYKKLYNDKNIIIYSILFPLAFLFNRTDFLGFTTEFFWLVFYYIFYSGIFKIIRSCCVKYDFVLKKADTSLIKK